MYGLLLGGYWLHVGAKVPQEVPKHVYQPALSHDYVEGVLAGGVVWAHAVLAKSNQDSDAQATSSFARAHLWRTEHGRNTTDGAAASAAEAAASGANAGFTAADAADAAANAASSTGCPAGRSASSTGCATNAATDAAGPTANSTYAATGSAATAANATDSASGPNGQRGRAAVSAITG